MVAEKADLGIAWDGDADRCFFVDDTGAFVPGDFITALVGESFCRKHPGAKIVYDCRASRAVADTVKAAGGVRTLPALLDVIDAGVTRCGATATAAILDDFKRIKEGGLLAAPRTDSASGTY